jgi:hypothetical protein
LTPPAPLYPLMRSIRWLYMNCCPSVQGFAWSNGRGWIGSGLSSLHCGFLDAPNIAEASDTADKSKDSIAARNYSHDPQDNVEWHSIDWACFVRLVSDCIPLRECQTASPRIRVTHLPESLRPPHNLPRHSWNGSLTRESAPPISACEMRWRDSQVREAIHLQNRLNGSRSPSPDLERICIVPGGERSMYPPRNCWHFCSVLWTQSV